jgi:hypothetical protein
MRSGVSRGWEGRLSDEVVLDREGVLFRGDPDNSAFVEADLIAVRCEVQAEALCGVVEVKLGL